MAKRILSLEKRLANANKQLSKVIFPALSEIGYKMGGCKIITFEDDREPLIGNGAPYLRLKDGYVLLGDSSSGGGINDRVSQILDQGQITLTPKAIVISFFKGNEKDEQYKFLLALAEKEVIYGIHPKDVDKQKLIRSYSSIAGIFKKNKWKIEKNNPTESEVEIYLFRERTKILTCHEYDEVVDERLYEMLRGETRF